MEYQNEESKNLTYEREQIPGTGVPFYLDETPSEEPIKPTSRKYSVKAKQIIRGIAFSLRELFYSKRKINHKKSIQPRTDPVSSRWGLDCLQGLNDKFTNGPL
ncbi:MAG: hypothetical protein AABX95_00845 [Nanoarchaeota archaeon]